MKRTMKPRKKTAKPPKRRKKKMSMNGVNVLGMEGNRPANKRNRPDGA